MFKRGTWLFAVLAGLFCTTPLAAEPHPFEAFEKVAHRICPERKLENLVGGHWIDIMLDGKGPAFNPAAQGKLNKAAGHFGRVLDCRHSITVDCAVDARLSAIQSEGLMPEAVRQICRDWRCVDEATCTYSPPTHASR